VADDILKRGYKWVFRANQTSSSNAVDQINFLKDIRTKNQLPIKRIALVYENTEWGMSATEALKTIAAKEGFEIVLHEAYPANTPDMTSLIVKLKNAKPDVVIPCSYLNDALLFMKTLKEMNVDVKVFGGGAGFTDPKFLESAGDTAKNMFILAAWDKDVLARKPQWATQYNDEFKAKYGYDFSEPSANSYQNVFILADAMERAKSAEPEAVRKALMETKIMEGPALINPYKAIEFGQVRGMTNQNIYTQMLILQVLDKRARVVWPFEFSPADVKMVWGTHKVGVN
jgi:branched-chain amino acid transport system substrate-binding protein